MSEERQDAKQDTPISEAFRKVVIGASIAGGGAALAYLSDQAAGFSQYGDWGPILAAGWAVVINAARKALSLWAERLDKE